jgi:hypothetical protein
MGTRFLSNDANGVETPWQSIDDILEALEDGRLDSEDYIFDSTRQAWQPIRKHSEVVAEWERRMSYRPVEQRRIIANARRPADGFPALSPEGATPVRSPAVSRIDATRRAHGLPQVDEIPAVRTAVAAGEVVTVLVILAALGFGLVLLVRAAIGLLSGPSASP